MSIYEQKSSSECPPFGRTSCFALNAIYRYLRALAALYIRMTFSAVEVYELLEPLLKDYRKLRQRSVGVFKRSPSRGSTCLTIV